MMVFVVALFAQNRLTTGPYGVIFRTSTAADTVTLTTTQMVGLLTGTPTAAANYTTPTAANICASLPQLAQVSGGTNTNYGHRWVIKNTSAGAFTITVVAGAGVTLQGTATVPQSNAKEFLVIPTACPNPVSGTPTAAVTITSIGAASAF